MHETRPRDMTRADIVSLVRERRQRHIARVSAAYQRREQAAQLIHGWVQANRNVPLAELASRAGIHHAHAHRIMVGERCVGADLLERIRRAAQ